MRTIVSPAPAHIKPIVNYCLEGRWSIVHIYWKPVITVLPGGNKLGIPEMVVQYYQLMKTHQEGVDHRSKCKLGLFRLTDDL